MVTQHPFTIGQYVATWAGAIALLICGGYPLLFTKKFQRNAIEKYERKSPFTRRFVSLSYLESATYFWHIRICGAVMRSGLAESRPIMARRPKQLRFQAAIILSKPISRQQKSRANMRCLTYWE